MNTINPLARWCLQAVPAGFQVTDGVVVSLGSPIGLVNAETFVLQTHWEPRPELDIDLNLKPSKSRDSDPGGKPVD